MQKRRCGRRRSPGIGAGPLPTVLSVWLLGASLAALLWPSRPAAAARQTVAVMPFRDLTQKTRAHVGEAIREVVTNDLKQISDLRIVERSSLDKVLAELKLQATGGGELDNATLSRVGKILGASVIVIGAYQESSPLIRLTARFVKVETSEVMGSAKVDGSVKEFFRLQDRVTSELLRSAGLPRHAKKVLDDSPARPDLSSLKALDLYGQAVVQPDDEQRRTLLRLVVAEDKNFSYAVKDLAELEQRMRGYREKQRVVLIQDLALWRAQLQKETDPLRRDALVGQMMQRLSSLRMYRTLIREARAYLTGLPAGTPLTQQVDTAAVYLVSADLSVRDWDGVLRDGEWYLQRAPGGSAFASIQSFMRSAIDRKRAIEQGRAQAVTDVASISSDARWDLCLVGRLYQRHLQYAEALRLQRACIEVGTDDKSRAEALNNIYSAHIELGDFAAAQKVLAQLEPLNPELARSQQALFEQIAPTDE
ncbi:MAG: CsgG/HfaB family protein [Polyangia bacterium]